MKTFVEVIDLWPNITTLAGDIDAKPDRVRKWRERNAIPSEQWLPLIRAAKARRIAGVTADVLTDIASSC